MSLSTPVLAQKDLRPTPIHVPSDGEPLKIEHIEDIPPQIVRAAQGYCQLEDSMLRDIPAVIFRPSAGSRAIAILPCKSVVGYSVAFIIDRRNEPTLATFPVGSPTGGITTSERPGSMTWDPSTKTISARAGTDLCSNPIARYTYRHDDTGYNGFSLTKIERSKKGCGWSDEWTTIWEAKPWNLQ
jgi:hypothetical protein